MHNGPTVEGRKDPSYKYALQTQLQYTFKPWKCLPPTNHVYRVFRQHMNSTEHRNMCPLIHVSSSRPTNPPASFWDSGFPLMTIWATDYSQCCFWIFFKGDSHCLLCTKDTHCFTLIQKSSSSPPRGPSCVFPIEPDIRSPIISSPLFMLSCKNIHQSSELVNLQGGPKNVT